MEFLLRTGSIDSRFTGFDRANWRAHASTAGSRRRPGEGYAAEVFLTAERTMEGIGFTIWRAVPTAFLPTRTGTVVIDEIKTTAVAHRSDHARI